MISTRDEDERGGSGECRCRLHRGLRVAAGRSDGERRL